MATSNWRDQLMPGTRQHNFIKIKNKLMRHCFRDEDGLLEIKKVAHFVEEKAYAGATSQSDYLEKIASAMQLIEKAHDWRVQLGPDYRQRSVNKISNTLRRHFPHNDPEELQVIWSIAQMIEENIFNVATSQTDYLQKISLKMLTMETKSQEDHGQPSNQFGPDNQPAYPVNLNCMDANNWRPNQGTEPKIDNSDWRGRLQPESRQRIVNEIMDTLKRHLPVSGQEGFYQLRKIAQRFEEKIFTAATNQSDYLRKISLKMLTMETKSQGTITMANNIPSNQVGTSNKPPNPASLDSTAQTGQPSGGDWQEEVYQKIKTMKENYLPELNEVYQKIAAKLQQLESLPQQPKSDQLEKLKVFKMMLERIITFLQVSKNNILPNFKEKLGSYEKQIINFINTNRPRKPMPSMQPGQLPSSHMHSMSQPQSQVTQVRSHENQMNSQLQTSNMQGSVATMQQNNMTSMQHNSMSGVSTAQQNMMNSMQPGTNLDPGPGNAMSSLQQVPVSSLQQNSNGHL